MAANNNGFVAVGYSNSVPSLGSFDCFIVSFDATLNILKKIFIGAVGEDYLNCIAKTSSGYVVGGYTKSFGFGNYDGLVMTLDEDLKIVKKVLIGGLGADTISAIAVTKSGNYVITGNTSSVGAGGNDIMLVTLDNDLNILKQLVFGGNKDETSSCVAINNDGVYAVVGNTPSVGAGNMDAFIATFGGNFADLTGSLTKYPALRINGGPGLQAKSDFSFTVNDNNTMTFVDTAVTEVLTPNLTINTSPSLLVDANAVTSS